MILIHHEKYITRKAKGKYNTKKYNTHVKREAELSSPELSMIEKGPKKKAVDIHPIPFQNDYPTNA